jgi:hypothetical protein
VAVNTQHAFSFMNFARVGEEFGDMALEHAWKVHSVLPLKGLSKEGCSVTPYELYYGHKPSVHKLRVLFCPITFKVFERQKTVKGITKHINSKNHLQCGIIGIFVGLPRAQAGYIIYKPRSGHMRVSGDVVFDETFSTLGPAHHFAFEDAFPVHDIASWHLTSDNFASSVPPDDHYGPQQVIYDKDYASNGFLITANPTPDTELFESDDSNLVLDEPLNNPDDVTHAYNSELWSEAEQPSSPLLLESTTVLTAPPESESPLVSDPLPLGDEFLYVDPVSIMTPPQCSA